MVRSLKNAFYSMWALIKLTIALTPEPPQACLSSKFTKALRAAGRGIDIRIWVTFYVYPSLMMDLLIPVSKPVWGSSSLFSLLVSDRLARVCIMPTSLAGCAGMFPEKYMEKTSLLPHYINRPTTTKLKKEKLPLHPPLVSWTVSLGSNSGYVSQKT